MAPSVFVAFRSLFQGDHLGVEFALRSHEVLLERGGLLIPLTRLQGNKPFPIGSRLEALVIDDYFAVGAEPVVPILPFALWNLPLEFNLQSSS